MNMLEFSLQKDNFHLIESMIQTEKEINKISSDFEPRYLNIEQPPRFDYYRYNLAQKLSMIDEGTIKLLLFTFLPIE